MRSHGPKTDLLILGSLGLGALVVIGIVLSFAGTTDDARSGAWVRTTQSTNLEGTMVAFELLRRLGFNPSRAEAPLSSTSLANVDVLFLIDPVVELRPPEQQALRQWVEGGGRLVSSGELWSASRPFHGITRKGGSEGSRGLAAPTAQALRIPDAHLALAKDVQVVALSQEWTLESKQGDLPGMGPVEPLLADGYGLRVAARSVGAGAVIVLADSSFLANGLIGREDDMIAVSNLASYAMAGARGGRLAFDESHFGMTLAGEDSGWWILGGMLLKTSPGWGVLALTAAGLLGLWLQGRRFGTRRGAGSERRRAKVEFVRAVGATYRARGANRLTLRIVFNALRRALAAASGLPASSDDTVLSARLAARSGADPAKIRETLRDCAEAAVGNSLSRRDLTRLVGRLASLEEPANPRAADASAGTANKHPSRGSTHG